MAATVQRPSTPSIVSDVIVRQRRLVDASAGTTRTATTTPRAATATPAASPRSRSTLTLADNKITEITVTPEATNGTSKQYQTKFAGGIADEVVGKSIDDLKVSKVAGSSLTSQGFNDAIDQIKADAQA